MDLLCQFAHNFPSLAAQLLHRDRHKRRNFREETITDVLMAGLTAFEPFGIRVDFPQDESKTGEDMDWEFVDPEAPDGRRYLRLHIQAKRAILSDGKRNPYWYYRELDHAVPKGANYGSQHEFLLRGAAAVSGCVPLYMFYHSLDAVTLGQSKLPAIEGVNVIFADKIPKKSSKGRWPVADRKVERWRQHFMPLSSLLCLGTGPKIFRSAHDGLIAFLASDGSPLVSPGALADRLNSFRTDADDSTTPLIEATDTIPPSILQALETPVGIKRSAKIERPRVIFHSRLFISDVLE